MCFVAAYQNAIREQKLAAEISAAKRERDFYMGQVDKAKGIEAMKERKRKVCIRPLSAVVQSPVTECNTYLANQKHNPCSEELQLTLQQAV